MSHSDRNSLFPGKYKGSLDAISDLSAIHVLVAPAYLCLAGEDTPVVLGQFFDVLYEIVPDLPAVFR